MSEMKDFKADIDSDAHRSPTRVVFITRRTAPAVKVKPEAQVMTYPEAFLRIAVAIELLIIVLVGISLLWNAPLEQLADPLHTPNPAKAPWYFLGLQELLHYFPPVVAGVLIPALVIFGLFVIPYAHVNAKTDGHFVRTHPWRVFGPIAALCVFLGAFVAYPLLIPTLAIAGFMFYAAKCSAAPASRFERWQVSKPLSFWMMTWFLVQLVVLTAIGTFFRGPGWSWVWPGRS
jgi:hypothetical protein